MFKLNWNNLFGVRMVTHEKQVEAEVKKLIEKYPTLFDSQLGPITGFKATIRMKSDAQPIFCKARPGDYALS